MRDLRTYITGMGSSGALLGAILIAFVTLAGVVAFNGMPGASPDPPGSDNDVFMRADPPASGGPADRDRSRRGDRDRPGADRDARGGGPGRPGGGGPDGSPGGDGGPQSPADVPPDRSPGPDPPKQPDPDPDPPAPTPPPAPPAPAEDGDVAAVVDEVDDAVAAATGSDPGLGAATKPVTEPVDDVIGGLGGGNGLGLKAIELPG